MSLLLLKIKFKSYLANMKTMGFVTE